MELDLDVAAQFSAALGEHARSLRMEAVRLDRELAAAVSYLDGMAFQFATGNATVLEADKRPKDGFAWAVQRVGIAGLNVPSVAPAVNQIPLAANAVAAYNNNSAGVNQTISGGTVTAIAINGTTTGATSGTFFVPAGGTVTVTYSVAPTTYTTAGIGVPTPDQIQLYRANSPIETVPNNVLHSFTVPVTGQDSDFWNPARSGLILKPKQGLATAGTFTGTMGVVSFDVIQIALPHLHRFLI